VQAQIFLSSVGGHRPPLQSDSVGQIRRGWMRRSSRFAELK
jgi:hypothetical protein